MQVEWSVPAGCPFKEENDDGSKGGEDDGKGPSEDKPARSGSGIGWFFLAQVFLIAYGYYTDIMVARLILAFAAYFGLGAYYNYSTYGARGADLIP